MNLLSSVFLYVASCAVAVEDAVLYVVKYSWRENDLPNDLAELGRACAYAGFPQRPKRSFRYRHPRVYYRLRHVAVEAETREILLWHTARPLASLLFSFPPTVQ